MTGAAMREWIAVFLPELVPDGAGGSRESVPANLEYDRPAAVRELSAAEVSAGDQKAQRVRYEITIHYDVAIGAAHRVYWRDRYLDIEAVMNPDMRDTWLTLDCIQREAGGQ